MERQLHLYKDMKSDIVIICTKQCCYPEACCELSSAKMDGYFDATQVHTFICYYNILLLFATTVNSVNIHDDRKRALAF
jgi:hypothetical protein